MATRTLEQVLSRRRKMLMDMASGIELELRDQLKDDPPLVATATTLLRKSLEYGAFSESRPPSWFNDDDNFAEVDGLGWSPMAPADGSRSAASQQRLIRTQSAPDERLRSPEGASDEPTTSPIWTQHTQPMSARVSALLSTLLMAFASPPAGHVRDALPAAAAD